jgi:carbon starvation protein CstA
MAESVFIIISILIFVVILAVLAIFLAKDRKKAGPDYYTMFLISLVWVPVGLFMQWRGEDASFWVVGLIFLAISVWNRDQWKRNHTPFNKLKKKQKRFALVVILILALIILIGAVIYYLGYV